MSERLELKQTFIMNSGWSKADVSFLAGDASPRKYDRLSDAQTGNTAVLMDSPSADDTISVFVERTEMLRTLGLSAPKILAQDRENGFLLIEDLGDSLFARVCKETPDAETELYSAAIDVLAELHRHSADRTLLPYDLDVYGREAALAIEWYLPDQHISAQQILDFNSLITESCADLVNQKTVITLRDYHAENLIWLPERAGLKKVGLLDYQDALAGHPAYDLVSLLEDARRVTSQSLQTTMFDRYIEQTGVSHRQFYKAYCTLGAQRNLKIIGIFARLCLRDGKSNYIGLIPRVWKHLQKDLMHPALTDLQAWVQQHLPEPTPKTLMLISDRCNHA